MRNLTLWIAAVVCGFPANAASGITYICDSTVNTLASQACNTLNTTIAALYSSTFTNANAAIYVKLGNAVLGSNVGSVNYYSYSAFRTALIAAQSSSNDSIAIADSVPATNPFGSSMVELSNPLQRALGLGPPTGGIDPNGGSCNPAVSPQCYDGVITMTNVQPLYFRTGSIASNQFDFYSTIEHETDEILGTPSCGFGNCSGKIFPADLFRYHSNGTRATSAGTNNPCTASDATNACFSLDGVHTVQQYNNLNSGLDAGDWATNCQAQLVQDADRCVGTAGVDLNIDAEILVLDVVGYTLKPRTNPPGPFTCTNTAAPSISSIDSASAYGGYSYFSSGSWLEIKGTNLADPNDLRLTAAVNPGQWTGADFSGGNAPIVLDGISVSINGKPAYVWYLSTNQLNVQAPEDSVTGTVAVNVTNCQGESSAYPFLRKTLAPGLLAPTNYTANGTQYMVATFASDGAYVLNNITGASFGLNSRPAKPGDLIIGYGVGFGDVTPSILPGVVVEESNALSNPITLSFGSAPATFAYSGLAGNFVGLYEFYMNVPAGLANGDYQINVAQNGAALPQKMYLTVHN